MTNLIGIFIFGSVALGLLMPYAALQLAPFGFIFLFLLMFFAGFSVNWSRLREGMAKPWPLVGGLLATFIFIPIWQWSLVTLLIDNQKLASGMLFASLMPVALVAPFFARRREVNAELAYALMLMSTLLTPLLSPAIFHFLGGTELPIKTGPLMLNLGVFAVAPLLASAIASAFLPRLGSWLVPRLPWLNAAALGFLIFILFGSVFMKINFSYLPKDVLAKLLLLALIQDFGMYFLIRQLARFFTDAATAKTLAISLSMKNVAISAGILLFYDPPAALPSAVVFLAHGFLFTWLGSRPRKR